MGSIAESHGRAAGICEIHSGDHRDAQSSSHDFISVSAVCIPSDSVGRYRCPFAIYCRKRTNSAGRRGRSSDCPLCRWRNARCDFPVRPVCSSFRGSDYAGSRCGGSWCIGSSTAVSDSGRCPSKSAGRCIERSRCLVSRLDCGNRKSQFKLNRSANLICNFKSGSHAAASGHIQPAFVHPIRLDLVCVSTVYLTG